MHTSTHDELFTIKRPTDASFACMRAQSIGARARPLDPFPAIPAFSQPPGACATGVPREAPWTWTWLAQGHPTAASNASTPRAWSSASEPLGRLPAAPPSPLGPSRIPTAPLMEGVAVELKKYEVGRDQDAKGVVQELRGACRRGRLRPVGTQTTQQVRVGGRRCRPEVPRRRGTPPPPSAACLPACSRKSLPRGPRTSPQ